MRLQTSKFYITRDSKRIVRIEGPGNIPGTMHGTYLGEDEDVHHGTWGIDGHWLSPEATSKYDLLEEVGTTI